MGRTQADVPYGDRISLNSLFMKLVVEFRAIPKTYPKGLSGLYLP